MGKTVREIPWETKKLMMLVIDSNRVVGKPSAVATLGAMCDLVSKAPVEIVSVADAKKLSGR